MSALAPPATIAVVRFTGGWRVLLEGRWRGRFDYQVDAVDEALRLLAAARRAGRAASMLVQGRFGEMAPFDDARANDCVQLTSSFHG